MTQSLLVRLGFFFLFLYFLVATLWNIHLPRPNWDEAGIAAPAHKLATTGIYGNDLAALYYHNDLYNYEYMPLYAVSMAAFFRLFGTSIVIARLLSVVCGGLILGLTYLLARRWYGRWAGLVAMGFLLFLRWGVNGVPLIVYSRVARYDIMVPLWVLAATLALDIAVKREDKRWFWVSGVAVGLATISHPLGAFMLVPFGIALVWHYIRSWRTVAAVYGWLIVGWIVPLALWGAYVAPHFEDYQGQNYRHSVANRFDLFNPDFYGNNIITEPNRYKPVTDLLNGNSFSARIALFSLLLLPCLVAWRYRAHGRFGDKVTLLTAPILALLLTLLISYKVYSYILILLPFIALQWAMMTVWLEGRVVRQRWLLIPLAVVVVVVMAAGVRITLETRRFESTLTPSSEVSRELQTVVLQDATVFMSQHLWFGWQGYKVHSLFTPFYFADPRYYPESPMTLEAAFLQYQPDYLIGGRYVEPDVIVPLHPGDSPFIQSLRADFARIRLQYCGTLVAEFEFAGYDRIPVYQCNLP